MRLNRNKADQQDHRPSESASTEALLSGILDGTSYLITALDHEYRFLAFNRAYRVEFKKIFGSDIALGASMIESLAHLPEEQKAAVAVWQRALAGEEYNIIRKFGDPARERRWYELRFSTVRGPDGQILGAAHFAHDATEQMVAEQDLIYE